MPSTKSSSNSYQPVIVCPNCKTETEVSVYEMGDILSRYSYEDQVVVDCTICGEEFLAHENWVPVKRIPKKVFTLPGYKD